MKNRNVPISFPAEVDSGTVKLSGSNLYSGLTKLVDGILELDGAQRISSLSSLELAGGELKMASVGAANGQTFSSLHLTGSSIIDLGDTTSITFNAFGGYTPSDALTIVNYNPALSPTYVIRFAGNLSANATFMALVNATTVDGQRATDYFDGIHTDIVAVPEPSSLIPVAVAVAGLLRRARRRNPLAL